MNVLSIHASHDGSISISQGNELIIHTEISRFNKLKHHALPTVGLLEKIADLNIVFDVILFSHLSNSVLELWVELILEEHSPVKFFKQFLRKKTKVIISDEHHQFHASCAQSFQKNTNYLVWDGNGTIFHHGDKRGVEQTSYYDNNVNNLYKYLFNPDIPKYESKGFSISEKNLGIGEAYSHLTRALGLFKHDIFSEGKAMALSSYGKYQEKCMNKIFTDDIYFPKEFLLPDKAWEKERNLPNNVDLKNINVQNFAFTFQKSCEFVARRYFKDLNINGPVTLTGGVAQNILINTDISKSFNFDVFVDPICNDQSISLGHLNYFLEHKLERPNHCYLGFKPNYDLNLFTTKFNIKKVTEGEVAKILFDEPVALFQGRSEQGQRALGNRSLLMNATNLTCIDKINTIKKREWYRPFACTILSEYFEEYFIRDTNRSAEFMMNVFNVKETKKNHLENVTCPQGTSRVQELKREKNNNFYDLIKAFNDIYNIPFLLNTSLNKPGLPIVEDLNDLKNMMLETNLKYAYLADINTLIIKK